MGNDNTVQYSHNMMDTMLGPLECFLPMIDLTPNDFPRYRDIAMENHVQNHGAYELCVVTRTGGGNREEYEEENKSLSFNKYYLSNNDASYDSTYAEFYFRVPDEFTEDIRKLQNKEVTNINDLSKTYTDKLRVMMPRHYNDLCIYLKRDSVDK